MSLQWIHSRVRQKNICNNNNNSSSYFVWFYFYFCYNSVFIMKWNKCLVIIFVTRASPTWVKWRTSALGTPPILQKVNNADSAIQSIYSCLFVCLFCFLHIPTRLSICAKQIYKKMNRRRVETNIFLTLEYSIRWAKDWRTPPPWEVVFWFINTCAMKWKTVSVSVQFMPVRPNRSHDLG